MKYQAENKKQDDFNDSDSDEETPKDAKPMKRRQGINPRASMMVKKEMLAQGQDFQTDFGNIQSVQLSNFPLRAERPQRSAPESIPNTRPVSNGRNNNTVTTTTTNNNNSTNNLSTSNNSIQNSNSSNNNSTTTSETSSLGDVVPNSGLQTSFRGPRNQKKRTEITQEDEEKKKKDEEDEEEKKKQQGEFQKQQLKHIIGISIISSLNILLLSFFYFTCFTINCFLF
jgi:hypothetical protein